MKKRSEEIDIKDLVGIFVPKLWLIVLCAVVLGAVLGGYAMLFKADTYTSTAKFRVTNSTSINKGDLELAYDIVKIMQEHFETRDLLEDLAKTVNERHADEGWDIKWSDLERSIKLSSTETGSFALSVTTVDAKKSFAIAEVLVTYMTPNPETQSPAPIKDFLAKNLQNISITKIESPVLPTSTNDKGIFSSAITGFLVGAVASMVVVYIVAMFDVVVHDRKKLEDYFDIPVLGVIPRQNVTEDDAAKEVIPNA